MNDQHPPGPQNRPEFVMVEPDRLIGRGHPAGDFLEAYEWKVLAESEGRIEVEAHLPSHARNPRGQLFGGFTPTYVDLLSLFAVRAGPGRLDRSVPRGWLATTNMRIDYFEPILGPTFRMEAQVEKRRGRMVFVSTRFVVGDELAVYALTTMRHVEVQNPLGDG